MKKLIETLKNIWKVEDLRMRILITILFAAIYRFGSFVVLPGEEAVAAAHHELVGICSTGDELVVVDVLAPACTCHYFNFEEAGSAVVTAEEVHQIDGAISAYI